MVNMFVCCVCILCMNTLCVYFVSVLCIYTLHVSVFSMYVYYVYAGMYPMCMHYIWFFYSVHVYDVCITCRYAMYV